MTSLEATSDQEETETAFSVSPRLHEAGAVFYAHRIDELKRYAERLTYYYNVPRSRLDPDDIAMEAITCTLEHWFEVSNHRAYAYEIVRNLVRRATRDDSEFEAAKLADWFGHDADDPEVGLGGSRPAFADLSDPLDKVIDAEVFRLLLKELPYQQRAAMFLRYYEDMTSKEIAPILGCKPATVDVHAYYGLKAISSGVKKAVIAGIVAMIAVVVTISGFVSVRPSLAGFPGPTPSPTPLPSGGSGLNPVGWDVPSTGSGLSWMMIPIGGVLVLLGIGAIARILIRRCADDQGYKD